MLTNQRLRARPRARSLVRRVHLGVDSTRRTPGIALEAVAANVGMFNQPDVSGCVCVGVCVCVRGWVRGWVCGWGGERGLWSRAHSTDFSARACTHSFQPRSEPISASFGKHHALRTPLELARVARALRAAGIRAEVSEDAGRYVCKYVRGQSPRLARSLSGVSVRWHFALTRACRARAERLQLALLRLAACVPRAGRQGALDGGACAPARAGV